MRTRRRTLADVAFWCVSALGAALFAFLLLAVSGLAPVESPRSAASVGTLPPVSTKTAPARERRARTTASAPRETAPTTTASAPARRVTVAVAATRGASWISARLGSSTGRVLDERILEQGETARWTGGRVWLLVGASANVDVLVDGKPRALAAGTVETLFSPS
jgi:hypothetical protein